MKALLITFLALLSMSSMAEMTGTPDQDPVVKSIRASFIKAKAPSEPDLQFGRTWKCKLYEATKGGFATADLDSYIFSSMEGIIINDGQSVVGTFEYQANGIVGADDYDSDGSVMEVRVNEKGDLIGEYSIPKSSLSRYDRRSQSTIIVPAIHDLAFRVLSYEVCRNRQK